MATLKNVELFRTGTHTDSSGHTRTWTLDDLKKIVSLYDPSKEEAPAVLGHPKDTAPAYGWLKQIWIEGERLLGDFYQVAEEFVRALKEGRFKKRSISLDRNFHLQHVGFLGAALPGVTGLKDIEFSADAETDTYEFTATNEGGTPKEEGMNLEQALAEIERLKAELQKLKDGDQQAEFKKKLDEANSKAKEATEALANFKKEQADKDLEVRIGKLIDTGKLLPADKGDTLAFAKAMDDGSATMNFSKEGGETEKVSPREAYLRKLESRSINGLLSEFAARTDNSGSNFSQSQGYDDATDLAAKM